MQQGSVDASCTDSASSSSESQGNSQQHDPLAESQVARGSPTSHQGPQQQQLASNHSYGLQQQSQQPLCGSEGMAACSSGACTSIAGAAVCNPLGDSSSQRCHRLPLDSFGSSAAERSLGQQLHQLSFELKEQLHVDAKRTRTAPSCCSLCKAAQPSESSCIASCDQPSSVLSGTCGAPHTPSEPSQCSGSPPSEGKGETVEEEASTGARQRKTGDDCCLTCNCPCHKSNDGPSSRIVCFEGPRRPPTFAANLAELCRAFPSVHQGLIVSLLETAENDLQRAHALVRVVSDTNTGLHNPKTGGPMTKRKRCPDADSECLGVLERPPNCLSALGVEGPSRGSGSRRASCGMDVGDGSPRTAPFSEQQQHVLLQQQVPAATASADATVARGHGGLPSLHMPLGAEQPPEAWCNEVAERLLWAIVTASSGEDAKAKAAALLREHAIQLARVQQEEPSQAELAKEAERQELAKRVELLQNDKLLLARAVKAQHEKLQTLQHNLAAKTEEALQLMQELSGAQQRLRSLRDAASALFLGASTGRNSPCRDNSFDRRFPDVF